MKVDNKDIKANQYYMINGEKVLVTLVTSLDVDYTIVGSNQKMVCDRGVFCYSAEAI